MDPDQLASHKPADLDLHCFQNWIDLSLAWKVLLFTILCIFSCTTANSYIYLIYLFTNYSDSVICAMS